MKKNLHRMIPLFAVLCLSNSGQAVIEAPEKTVDTRIYETVNIIKQQPLVLLQAKETSEETEITSLGIFKLTAYCCENYPHICNDGDSSTTATGTTPTPGRTIAVDPNVIPYGSEVIINGHSYIAEDCGGAVKGNRIDIVFSTHEEALQFGVRYAEMYVKSNGS